jgi:hypothetical protein
MKNFQFHIESKKMNESVESFAFLVVAPSFKRTDAWASARRSVFLRQNNLFKCVDISVEFWIKKYVIDFIGELLTVAQIIISSSSKISTKMDGFRLTRSFRELFKVRSFRELD